MSFIFFSSHLLPSFKQFDITKISGCMSDQFTCADGQCVPITARCNSVRNCRDGSDEQNCGNNSYPGLYFCCFIIVLYLSCLLNYVISDVFVSIGCSSSQFTCANGQCVSLTARCNSVNECADNSDEQNCGNKWILQENILGAIED